MQKTRSPQNSFAFFRAPARAAPSTSACARQPGGDPDEVLDQREVVVPAMHQEERKRRQPHDQCDPGPCAARLRVHDRSYRDLRPPARGNRALTAAAARGLCHFPIASYTALSSSVVNAPTMPSIAVLLSAMTVSRLTGSTYQWWP